MKKSKVILAIVLAVVLVATIVSVPTFSWFSRPHSQSGEQMRLITDNVYGAYNGKNVTISTNSSSTGVADPDSYTTACSTATDFSCQTSETALPSNMQKYFCTTITNSSDSPQNVSLYASKLSIPAGTNGTLALGVNGPTRSYRDYTSLTNKNYSTALGYDKRIYFQTYNVPGWGDGHDIYVTFGFEYGQDSRKMKHIKYDSTWGHIFYADIPYTANWMYFTSSGWKTAGQNGGEDWTMRSATVNNMDNTRNSIGSSGVYRIKNDEDGNHNRPIESGGVNGASISQYCDSITLATNATFSAATGLQKQGSVEYYAYPSDGSIFTVDQNTGQMQGISAGTGTLFIKVIGGTYGDNIQMKCSVTVTENNSYDFYDVPIVKNIYIPGEAGDDENKPKNVVKVYWYIINNSETTPLQYTIDNIYLSM